MRTFLGTLIALLAVTSVAHARDVEADPSTLAAVLPTLVAGDTLHLASGTYAGRIRITSLNGTAEMPIVVEGPEDGSAVIEADPGPCCNMLELRDSSYLVLRHLTFDGAGLDGAFGISAGSTGAGGTGTRNLVHHVTIEGCHFIGFGGSNNHDAISTKTTTWAWVLRENVFEGAGIGAYFGDSNGFAPFIGGLIEHNAFLACGGYCMQIKFQEPRPTDWPGMPTDPQATIIRHNVFQHGDEDRFSARPSLLVGGFPASGPGSEDRYEIYGNLFVHNAREALLQASGRVSIHDNVFVDGDDAVPALVVRAHDLPLRQAHVYGNTFYTAGDAIAVGTGDQGSSLVGNAIYAAGDGVSGTFDEERDNVTGDLAAASSAFVSASLEVGTMDFHPAGDALAGSAIALGDLADELDSGLDFECRDRATRTFRGAYEGPASERRWDLALEIKPDLCGAGPGPGADGGAGDADAGIARDDASVGLDGATSGRDGGADAGEMAGSCSCRAAGAGGLPAVGWVLAAAAIAGAAFRRRGRRAGP